MRGLAGKVAFVTGAGRGMGAAIAARLVEEGARVAVTDVDRSTAEATAAALGEDHAVGIRVDITDTGSVHAGVLITLQTLGPIDVLVNNAGWDRIAPFVDTDEDLWDRLIDINLKGPLRCTHAVLPGMIERQAGGRVINISSDAARVGSTGESVYSAAKAGIIGFTKTLARETARHNITANVICPGPTDTALLAEVGEGNDKLIDSLKRGIPMKRLGRPDDVAGVVAFLASDDAGFITGQTLSVSGGLTMA